MQPGPCWVLPPTPNPWLSLPPALASTGHLVSWGWGGTGGPLPAGSQGAAGAPLLPQKPCRSALNMRPHPTTSSPTTALAGWGVRPPPHRSSCPSSIPPAPPQPCGNITQTTSSLVSSVPQPCHPKNEPTCLARLKTLQPRDHHPLPTGAHRQACLLRPPLITPAGVPS